MEEKSYSESLKELRKRLRLKQQEMAEKLGVTRANYKNWEYGQSLPPQDIRKKIEKLEKSPEKPSEVSEPKIPASQLLIPIPYIGLAAASVKMKWSDPFEVDAMEYVPPEMGDARGRFCCRVESDSMMPLLQPGDLCVFQQGALPKLNHIFLYRHPDQRVTIKQLKHNGESWVLHALNKGVKDVDAKGEVVGMLVGIVREIGRRRITDYDPDGIRP